MQQDAEVQKIKSNAQDAEVQKIKSNATGCWSTKD
jgi:hypothetical protein